MGYIELHLFTQLLSIQLLLEEKNLQTEAEKSNFYLFYKVLNSHTHVEMYVFFNATTSRKNKIKYIIDASENRHIPILWFLILLCINTFFPLSFPLMLNADRHRFHNEIRFYWQIKFKNVVILMCHIRRARHLVFN